MVTFAETYFYSLYQMYCWTVLVFLSSTLLLFLLCEDRFFNTMFITVSVTADALTLNASLRPSMMLALALSHEMLLFLLHLGLLVNNFFNLL